MDSSNNQECVLTNEKVIETNSSSLTVAAELEISTQYLLPSEKNFLQLKAMNVDKWIKQVKDLNDFEDHLNSQLQMVCKEMHYFLLNIILQTYLFYSSRINH